LPFAPGRAHLPRKESPKAAREPATRPQSADCQVSVRGRPECADNGDGDDDQQDAPTHLIDRVGDHETSQRRVSRNIGKPRNGLASQGRRPTFRREMRRPQHRDEAGGSQQI